MHMHVRPDVYTTVIKYRYVYYLGFLYYKDILDKMEKNPISILQEYAMSQMKVLPIYTVIVDKVSTDIPNFKIKVEFHSYIAVGQGMSKKEAKVNAALKMLNLLNLSTNTFQQSIKSLDTSINSLNNSNSDINITLNSPSSSINYIGKLQEHGVKLNILPDYVVKSACGPPHNMEFVIACKYDNLEEEATGKTKKEAKMLSAKKMYYRLLTEVLSTMPKFEEDQTMSKALSELKIFEENSNWIEASSKKALAYFPKVSKTVTTENANDKPCCISQYHTFLKNSYTLLDRKLALDKLKIVMEDCANFISCRDKNIDIIIPFKTILKELNIDFTKRETMDIKKKFFLYNLVLKTNPSINEFGYGKSKNDAEIVAIYQMAKTLFLLLS